MISIVMAYLNRKALLDKTLESIRNSQIKNYELIIVDDGSDEPLVCDEAKVIRIEPKDKWWSNPVIPFNMGFKEAKGDVVLIQNPECYHIGDVLTYVTEHIELNDYISFSCYAMPQQQTEEFHRGIFPKMNNSAVTHTEKSGWYNHPIYAPVGYHFCSAISRQVLNAIGGFDERYAFGVAFDDNAFIRTIKRWELNVRIVDNPYVLHQYHPPMSYGDPKRWRPLYKINADIFATT
jgi:glycosyltransferase involved in cell wall biosynthesis